MTSVSGLWSGVTFVGYATSSNTTTVTSGLTTVDSIAIQSGTKYYVIGTYTTNVEATFYYSKATDGTTASATASGIQTRNVYCKSTSAATTSLNEEGTITAPTINNEVAPTGTVRVSDWATANSNMSTTSTLNTGITKYYAVYRNALTIYYPTSTSAVSSTNTALYRKIIIMNP